MGKYAGKSKLALRPKSTEQVSKVLAYCNDRRLAIVPQVRASSKRAGSTIPNFSQIPWMQIGAQSSLRRPAEHARLFSASSHQADMWRRVGIQG